MNNKLSRTIMRRIYYAYAIGLITRPGIMQGVVMFSALILLMRYVSLGNVLANLMGVQVGNIGTFVYNAVATTEVWTLLLLGVFIFAALSFRFTIRRGGLEQEFARA